MGNTQEQKKIPVINKTQLQVACTKARIHLQMMRDRKNAEIIKGQRQLVTKLKSPCRNKVEQLLIAQRVTNGLKYAQACNQLASYASSLKSQANFISQNVANQQKIEPWLIYIFSLQFAADHMGLSSLNDFRRVIRTLYDPQGVTKYCNPDIILLLSPTPTAQELNLYIVEMSERNEIPLQEINIVGHKFTKDWSQPSLQLDQHLLDAKKKIADQIANNMNQGQGGKQGDFPFGGQGGQGGLPPGGQGQSGGNQGGFGGGNQGGFGGGNQGGYGGGNQGGYTVPTQGGYTPQQPRQDPYSKINPNQEQINPYKGISSMNHGPQYYEPQIKPSQSTQKPHQFTSFQQMMRMTQQNNHKLEVYPDVDPKEYKASEYKPVHNPFTPPEQQESHNSPTLSQIMRDFDKKE